MWRIMRMSASSCVAFKLSKFRLLSLLSVWSSEINPPQVTTTLPSGACRMSYVAKKKAKSSLFAGKERKLGKLEGRRTLRFLITLLIGCTDFDLFCRFPDFIDCVRYRSKTTSIRLNLTPFLSTTPTYMSAYSPNVLKPWCFKL